MLRISLLLGIILLGQLLHLGCRKDIEQFQPYAPTSEELSSVLAQQVPSQIKYTVFNLHFLNADKMLETPGGTRIFLIDTDHLFSDAASGMPVLCSTCADLKVEVTEAISKSDIIARGLNTMGVDGAFFESGGMVNVSVSCNGKPLALLADRQLKIQMPHTDPQDGFFVFHPFLLNGKARWTNNGQEVFKAEWPVADGTTRRGFELLTKNLGWTAAGKQIDEPSSTFCVTLPAGFGDQNTLTYLVFKNQVVVAPLEFELSSTQFCVSNAPAGFQVQIVALSKLGDQYWLGAAQTEIGTNAIMPLNTQQSSQAAVLDFIKGL